MTAKDKKIIEDSERDGIPIFVLTAKDSEAPVTLLQYWDNCSYAGCKPEHLLGIKERRLEFEAWQRKYRDRVKLPD
jgi:hypothetical protein